MKLVWRALERCLRNTAVGNLVRCNEWTMHCGAVYVKTWLSAKKDLKPFTSQRWPSWDGQLHIWWYEVFVNLPWFALYFENLFPVSLVNIARLRIVKILVFWDTTPSRLLCSYEYARRHVPQDFNLVNVVTAFTTVCSYREHSLYFLHSKLWIAEHILRHIHIILHVGAFSAGEFLNFVYRLIIPNWTQRFWNEIFFPPQAKI